MDGRPAQMAVVHLWYGGLGCAQVIGRLPKQWLSRENGIAKTDPASTSIPERVPKCSCFSGIHFKNIKWVFFTRGPATFQGAAFALGPRVSWVCIQTLYEQVLHCLGSVDFLDIIPIVFHFGGSSLWCRTQGLGCLMWASFFTPQVVSKFLRSFLIVGCCTRGGVFDEHQSLFPLPISTLPLSSVVEILSV